MIPTNEFINDICEKMSGVLERFQLERLRNVLFIELQNCTIDKPDTKIVPYEARENEWYIKKFLVAKKVAGLTEPTLAYYSKTLNRILCETFEKKITDISSDDMLLYFAKRDIETNVNKVTQDNERRILSSFFNWCRDEEYISKIPISRMSKIKTPKKQKPAFTEMEIEQIRSACVNAKESAVIEVLLSTGCRVSELVNIKADVVGNESTVIFGKGQKDRTVYFNAKSQIALLRYMNERSDKNPFLFPRRASSSPPCGKSEYTKGEWYRNPDLVAVDGHADKGSIESMVRRIGKRAGLPDGSVYPHKFRRTCATLALRRGMSVVQVSKMLGHASLEVTQVYLDIADDELAQAHKKYVV